MHQHPRLHDPAEDVAVEIDDRGGLEDSLDILSGLVTIEGTTDDDDDKRKYPESEASDSEGSSNSIAYSSPRIRKYTMVRLVEN